MGMLRCVTAAHIHVTSVHVVRRFVMASSNHWRHRWFVPIHSNQTQNEGWRALSIQKAASMINIHQPADIIVSFYPCWLIDVSFGKSQTTRRPLLAPRVTMETTSFFAALLMQDVGPSKPETGGKEIMNDVAW